MMLNAVKNALVRYYKNHEKELNDLWIALDYSVAPWNTYALYHSGK